MDSWEDSKSSEKSPKEKPLDLNEAFDGINRWFRRLVAAGVIAFCSTLLVAAGLHYYERENDKAQAQELENARIDRQQEACRQDNFQTQRTRKYSEDQLVQIFSIFSRSGQSPEEVRDRLNVQLDQYSHFVNTAFQYRDCSKSCVIAYYTETPDCPAPKDFPH